ncbi:hypothetical protein BJ993_001665 [Nocardioides aromaticivorans]|uniref:Lipoprotein n=1 Tax=Nocardioides aromaticivorans TaxID=200618 RepID=A0A7Y9ZGU5_9ACTN|nr:hypothetical protein [Nocardioides aromaticivorans]NYI44585.1 hypothetical protein [Nocardioides aromaticivorans]
MRMRTSRTAAGLAAVVLTLAGVSGCGGDDPEGPGSAIAGKEPEEVLAASLEAMQALEDVTYRGTTTVTSQAGRLRGTGELVVTADGTCQSTFHSSRRGRLVTRTVGNTVYVFADAAMMRGPLQYDADKVRSLTGRWQAAPRPSSHQCDLAELLPEEDRFAGFEDAGTGEVDGAPVRTLTGKDDDGSPMTVSIAAEGAPLLLAVETRRGGRSSFTLAEHDSGVELVAPPDGKVVSTS